MEAPPLFRPGFLPSSRTHSVSKGVQTNQHFWVSLFSSSGSHAIPLSRSLKRPKSAVLTSRAVVLLFALFSALSFGPFRSGPRACALWWQEKTISPHICGHFFLTKRGNVCWKSCHHHSLIYSIRKITLSMVFVGSCPSQGSWSLEYFAPFILFTLFFFFLYVIVYFGRV